MTKIFSFLNSATLLFLLSCAPPQTEQKSQSSTIQFLRTLNLPVTKIHLALSDYQQGILANLNLENLSIERLRPIVADVKLKIIGHELMALSREGEDSIGILEPNSGKVLTQKKLPENFNAFDVIRDDLGRIWITGTNSNLLYCFDKNLNQIENTIDLSDLRDSDDQWAEPAQILLATPKRLLVSAQRLRRNFNNTGFWVPEEESALAIIDTENMTLNSWQKIPVSNPVALMMTSESKIELVGSGDLSKQSNLDSSQISLKWNGEKIITDKLLRYKEAKILAAGLLKINDPMTHESKDTKMVKLVWWPNYKKSCVEVNQKEIFCQSNDQNGYIFSQIQTSGQAIFLSFVNEAALLIINSENGEWKKINLPMPAISMAI